jgi:hypothetical protein
MKIEPMMMTNELNSNREQIQTKQNRDDSQTVEKFVSIKMTYLISTFKFRLLISIAGGQTNAFKPEAV